MNENIAQWVAVVVGVALIVIDSGLMIAIEGTSGWSWIPLLAGIASLTAELGGRAGHGCAMTLPRVWPLSTRR